MVDVFHHISNRDQYFKKLKDYLKPGGRLALIDFTETSPMGPPPAERISPARAKSELIKAGYELAVEHVFLPNRISWSLRQPHANKTAEADKVLIFYRSIISKPQHSPGPFVYWSHRKCPLLVLRHKSSPVQTTPEILRR